jgi:hypothetical protein
MAHEIEIEVKKEMQINSSNYENKYLEANGAIYCSNMYNDIEASNISKG